MEFWEYEAGLTPVTAGYVPTPAVTQAMQLAQTGISVGMQPGTPFTPASVAAAQQAAIKTAGLPQLLPAELGVAGLFGKLLSLLGVGGPAALAGGAAAAAAAALPAIIPGLQAPWETVTGEGWIAPWTEQIQTTGGKYMQAPSGIGDQVVSAWSTGTWTFYRLASGKIGTFTRSGMWKTWRPYKPLVVGKTVSLPQARRMISKLKTLKKVYKTVAKL